MNAIITTLLTAGLMTGAVSAQDPKEGMMIPEVRQKVEDARKAHREAVKPLHEQMKQAMEKLREQVKSKASDSEIQATLNQVEKTREELRGARERFHSRLKSLLTPTQQARMMLKMKRNHHRGKDRGDHSDHDGPDDME